MKLMKLMETNETNGNHLNLLSDFITKHEISTDYAIKLRQLEGYDIVVICDDSGSMKTPVSTPNTKSFLSLPTRWQEMQNIVSIITEVSIILDDDGTSFLL